MQGQGEEGWPRCSRAIAAWRATGAALSAPYFCTLLAEVAGVRGSRCRGPRPARRGATPWWQQHEERWWEAEIHRLQGVLLLRQPGTPQAEAEACFQRALDVARRQEAKSWSCAPP